MIDKNFKGINEINKVLKIVLGAIIIFFIVFMAVKKATNNTSDLSAMPTEIESTAPETSE